jgi:hypothetical protein
MIGRSLSAKPFPKSFHQRESVTSPVADLAVAGVSREPDRGKLNRSDQFVGFEIGLLMRRMSGQTMKRLEGNRPRAFRTFYVNDCFQRRQRRAHVRWMCGDTTFRGPQKLRASG